MLERGEITEAEFARRLEEQLDGALRPGAPAPALLRAPRAQPADDRVGRRRAARARPAHGAAHQQRARVGAALAGQAARARARSSSWWSTPRSWACASPSRRSTSSRSSASAAGSSAERVPVRGRPRGQLRGGPRAGHDARCASSTPSRRSPSSSQRSPSRPRQRRAHGRRARAPRSGPGAVRQALERPPGAGATSAARSVARSSAGTPSSSRRKTRSSLGRLRPARRGEPAGHHVGLVLDQQRGTAHAADLLVEAAALGHELRRCARPAPARRRSGAASASRARTARGPRPRSSASRSGKCWNTERSDTPAPAAICAAVGLSSPSSSSASSDVDQRLAGALGAHGAAVALLWPGPSASAHCPGTRMRRIEVPRFRAP